VGGKNARPVLHHHRDRDLREARKDGPDLRARDVARAEILRRRRWRPALALVSGRRRKQGRPVDPLRHPAHAGAPDRLSYVAHEPGVVGQPVGDEVMVAPREGDLSLVIADPQQGGEEGGGPRREGLRQRLLHERHAVHASPIVERVRIHAPSLAQRIARVRRPQVPGAHGAEPVRKSVLRAACCVLRRGWRQFTRVPASRRRRAARGTQHAAHERSEPQEHPPSHSYFFAQREYIRLSACYNQETSPGSLETSRPPAYCAGRAALLHYSERACLRRSVTPSPPSPLGVGEGPRVCAV